MHLLALISFMKLFIQKSQFQWIDSDNNDNYYSNNDDLQFSNDFILIRIDSLISIDDNSGKLFELSERSLAR